MRELARAPPRLVRRLMGALLLVAPPARGRYPALGAVFRVSFAASRFATHGAPTSRTPWPLGALPFPVRLLMETLLPVALPLPVAPLLRVPCFLVPVLPLLLLLLLMGLRCRLRLGPWALLRPLCNGSWALCCL